MQAQFAKGTRMAFEPTPNEFRLEAESTIHKVRVVTRFSHIGDVILLSGVLLWRFKELEERFIVITAKGMADIFKYNPAVLEVVEYSKDELRGKNLKKVAKELAEEYPYPLYDMHDILRTKVIKHFWQSQTYTYNKDFLPRRIFLLSRILPNRIRPKSLNKHVVERYAYNFSTTIPTLEELKPHIFLDKYDEEFAETFFKKRQVGSKKIIAIHPFATNNGKVWAEDNWKKLYIELLDAHYFPLFIGVGKDYDWVAKEHKAINACTLRESATLLSKCTYLVTGDSAPLHLARAVDTPVIALFGATATEWGFFPIGSESKVLQKKLQCVPCSLHGKVKNCPRNFACINDITAKDVMEAINN